VPAESKLSAKSAKKVKEVLRSVKCVDNAAILRGSVENSPTSYNKHSENFQYRYLYFYIAVE
jgi:hypothetical protein